MSDSCLELYHDHYKDTHGIIERTVATRDLSFIWAAMAILSAAVLTAEPLLVFKAVHERAQVDFSSAYYLANTLLLVLAVWLWIRYFQKQLYLEQLYLYIHAMEDRLVKAMGKDFPITREGKSYLDPYPGLKTSIHRFYNFVVPALLILLAPAKIYSEWTAEAARIPLTMRWIDAIALVVLAVAALQYLDWFRSAKEPRLGTDGEQDAVSGES